MLLAKDDNSMHLTLKSPEIFEVLLLNLGVE